MSMEKADNTNRFNEISIMRVMAMIMIVAFHSMCFYNGRWVKFNALTIPFWEKLSAFFDVIDLNMFVFISGYLYGYLYIYKNKYRSPLPVIRNKATRLLIPYCFWGIPMALVWPWNRLSTLFYGIGHLWFLLMLFGVFTLIVLLQTLKVHKVKYIWTTGVVFIALYFAVWYVFTTYVNPHDFLCGNKILMYFPAFVIGYVCAELRVGWMLPNWSYILLPFVVLVLLVFVWYPLPLPSGLITLVRTLCAYVICVELLIILSKGTMKGRVQRIVQEVERLSMGLYIFNQIVMDIVLSMPVFNRWFEAHWAVGPFVLFTIGFFLPLFLSYIFNKYRCLKWTIGG